MTKLTPFRPRRSVIFPLVIAPSIAPIVSNEPKSENCKNKEYYCKFNITMIINGRLAMRHPSGLNLRLQLVSLGFESWDERGV